MSKETNPIKPGDAVKVLVAGYAYRSATPGVWSVEIDDDSVIYADTDEMLPTGADVKPLVQAPALRDFARWIVSLDDPDGQGFEARKSVSMAQIIGKAREALALPEE
jgi:hypothetical protein